MRAELPALQAIWVYLGGSPLLALVCSPTWLRRP